jgi:hypothetical protein
MGERLLDSGWLLQDIEAFEGLSQPHLPFQKDLHELPKAARVVIPDSFGVTEGLQERCCLQDLGPRRRGVHWGAWPYSGDLHGQHPDKGLSNGSSL